MAELTKLLQSEREVLNTLKQRLKAVESTRVPTLILSGHGSFEERLGIVLHKLAEVVNGQYCDLTSPEVIDRLKNSPPLYGRLITKYLSAAAMRQFLQTEFSASDTSTLTMHIPVTIWKFMSNVHPDEPIHFLEALFGWKSPHSLVLSYSWGVDSSIPSLQGLPNLPAHHIVELAFSDAERRYLDGEWEETFHDGR